MINQRRSTYPDREPVQTTGATSILQFLGRAQRIKLPRQTTNPARSNR